MTHRRDPPHAACSIPPLCPPAANRAGRSKIRPAVCVYQHSTPRLAHVLIAANAGRRSPRTRSCTIHPRSRNTRHTLLNSHSAVPRQSCDFFPPMRRTIRTSPSTADQSETLLVPLVGQLSLCSGGVSRSPRSSLGVSVFMGTPVLRGYPISQSTSSSEASEDALSEHQRFSSEETIWR